MRHFTKYEIQLLTISRLKYITSAAAHISYWASMFSSTDFTSEQMKDLVYFSRLPIATRKNLMNIPLEQRSDPARAKYFKTPIIVTSGSTGHPLHFYSSPIRQVRIRGYYRHIISELGRSFMLFETTTPTVFNLGMWNHRGLYPWQGFSFGKDMENALYRKVLFDKWGNNPANFLYTSAAYLKRLFFWSKQDGFIPSFRAIIFTAQGLEHGERDELTRYFCCPLISFYGTHETTLMGVECLFQIGRFHLVPEMNHTEIVDELGKVLSIGKWGRVISTPFDNEISPFIRYDVADRGKIEENPNCPCGRKTDFLVIEGRTTDYILLSHERQIVVREITVVLDKLLLGKAYQFQLDQRDRNKLKIRIVPTSQFTTQDQTHIISKVTELLGGALPVSLEMVPSIPVESNGKIRLFLK